jgi:hypothetical protein
MRKGLILLLVSMAILVALDVDAMEINYNTYSPYENNITINEITQYNTVRNDGTLHLDLYIQGFIDNVTFLTPESTFELNLHTYEQDKAITPSNIDGKVYTNCSASRSGDYENITLNDCGKDNEIMSANTTLNEYTIDLTFNMNDVAKWDNLGASKYFYIKLTYDIEDFIIHDGEYYVAWMQTRCNKCSDESIITRTIMLPPHAILESWNNFKIIEREVDSEGEDSMWVLESKAKDTQGDETKDYVSAMVWYRDAEKEKMDRLFRDLTILFLATGLTIVFGFLSSDTLVRKKTRFLWIGCGLSLTFAMAIELTRGRNNSLLIELEIILFILFIAFGIYAIIRWYIDRCVGSARY